MSIKMPEYKWRIFIVTGLANISAAIAISSINLAMPVMAKEFDVSMTDISWMSLVFSLVYCCTLLVFGRLADLYGYKRQFIIGFLVFGISSLLLPILSRGLVGLIFFRCFQALGGSMLISITQALCNRVFPAEERGKALGVNSIFVSIGYSAGPSVSGMLLSHFSWRSIFYFNVPFALIGALMAFFVLKKREPEAALNRRMDWPGSLFFAIFITFLTLALNFSADWGFGSAKFLGCLAISLPMFAFFVWRENRTDMPLMKLDLYKNPVFAFSNGASACSYTLQQMTTFLVPFYMINILLISESDSGFIMLATPLAMMIFSPIGGRMADRFGSRLPSLIGLFSIAAGCAAMSFQSALTPGFVVTVILFLYGVGNGLSVSAINSAIFSAVPREHSGMASGTVATVRHVGYSLGVAFGGAIMTLRQNYYLAGEGGLTAPDENAIYLLAQRDAFYFGLLVVAIAIFCVFRMPGKKGR